MRYNLKDLCEIKYGKNQKKVEDPTGTVPIYGTGGIMGYANQYLYDKPSVLIPRKGSISKVSFSNEPFWTVDTLFYTIVNEAIVIPKYLYYILSRIDLTRYNEGTTIPSLRTETLNRIELDIPKLEEQKQVVKILDLLEEKIKINQEMLGKLDSFSRLLFNHWFVDFEFTDEKGQPYKSSGGETVESDLGLIPKGWEVGTVKSIANKVSSGGTPSRKNLTYWENASIPWIKTKEIKNNYIISSEEFISEEGLKNSAAKMVGKNAVLVAMYGATAGKLALLKFSAATNQACCAIETFHFNYLYQYLSSIQQSIENLSTGSAQQNLSKQVVENIRIIIPCNDVLQEYENIMVPISNQIENIYLQNKKLKETRDCLLPKLLSGEIEIPIEAEILSS